MQATKARQGDGLPLFKRLHLSLMPGESLRNVVLETQDPVIREAAAKKLLERGNWLELWEVVLRSSEGSGARVCVRELIFSEKADRKQVERVGNWLIDACERVRDAEAAALLCDWLIHNGVGEQLLSIAHWARGVLKETASARLAESLGKDEVEKIF